MIEINTTEKVCQLTKRVDFDIYQFFTFFVLKLDILSNNFLYYKFIYLNIKKKSEPRAEHFM